MRNILVFESIFKIIFIDGGHKRFGLGVFKTCRRPAKSRQGKFDGAFDSKSKKYQYAQTTTRLHCNDVVNTLIA